MGKTNIKVQLTWKDIILIIILIPLSIIALLGIGIVFADLLETLRLTAL